MSQIISKTHYLFRREMWEHKGTVVWAPVGIAAASIALILLSLIFGLDDFSRHARDILDWAGGHPIGGDEETRRIDFSRGEIVSSEDKDLDWLLWGSRLLGVFSPSMHSIALGFELVALIVSVFYLLGGLFNDRKDRSILFWKSLPFSETHGVLVKLGFAALVIPVTALLVSLAVQLVFGASIFYVIARITEFSVGEILSQVSFFSVFSIHLLLIAVFAVKNLPLFSWLLFSSAASKRSPFLMAILPPVAIGALEALIFGSSYFSDFIGSLFVHDKAQCDGDDLNAYLLCFIAITPLQLLKIIAISVPLLCGAIWLRNNRYEI